MKKIVVIALAIILSGCASTGFGTRVGEVFSAAQNLIINLKNLRT